MIKIYNMFCIEPYLKCIEDPYIRKGLTCFQISAHGLRVETGRYKRIDKENRTFLICNSEEIEDDVSFYDGMPRIYEFEKRIFISNTARVN